MTSVHVSLWGNKYYYLAPLMESLCFAKSEKCHLSKPVTFVLHSDGSVTDHNRRVLSDESSSTVRVHWRMYSNRPHSEKALWRFQGLASPGFNIVMDADISLTPYLCGILLSDPTADFICFKPPWTFDLFTPNIAACLMVKNNSTDMQDVAIVNMIESFLSSSDADSYARENMKTATGRERGSVYGLDELFLKDVWYPQMKTREARITFMEFELVSEHLLDERRKSRHVTRKLLADHPLQLEIYDGSTTCAWW